MTDMLQADKEFKATQVTSVRLETTLVSATKIATFSKCRALQTIGVSWGVVGIEW